MIKVAHLTSAHPRDDIRIFGKMCRSLVAAHCKAWLVVADGLFDEIRDGVQIHDVGASKGRFDRIKNAPSRVFAATRHLAAKSKFPAVPSAASVQPFTVVDG